MSVRVQESWLIFAFSLEPLLLFSLSYVFAYMNTSMSHNQVEEKQNKDILNHINVHIPA
jgi:hypothetical protein